MDCILNIIGAITQQIAKAAKHVTSHKLLLCQSITLLFLSSTSSLSCSCFPGMDHHLPCSNWWHGWEDNTKCRLCRWHGEEKPSGDLPGLEKYLRQQTSLITGDHSFKWSRAPGLLYNPREVNIPIARWNITSWTDEAENTVDTVKGWESIHFPVLKMIIYACLTSYMPCSTTHELHAHPSVVKVIYLVHTEFMHSICVQVWTDKKRCWDTHKP